MAFIRAFKRSGHTYYGEVESYRDEQGRPRQRVLRYWGSSPTPPPEPVALSGVQFGVLATRLMEGTLTPRDVLDLLTRTGSSAPAQELEAVGIRFDFLKKTLELHLYPPNAKPAARPRAPRAKAGSAGKGSGRKAS